MEGTDGLRAEAVAAAARLLAAGGRRARLGIVLGTGLGGLVERFDDVVCLPVDVTGWLGGYNFQWAWSSGWAAGQVA